MACIVGLNSYKPTQNKLLLLLLLAVQMVFSIVLQIINDLCLLHLQCKALVSSYGKEIMVIVSQYTVRYSHSPVFWESNA